MSYIIKKVVYIYILFLLGCQNYSTSFWIEENPKYNEKSDSVHSAFISFLFTETDTEVSLTLRGKVEYDGGRKVLVRKTFNVTGLAEKYEIEWISSRSCRIKIFVEGVEVERSEVFYKS